MKKASFLKKSKKVSYELNTKYAFTLSPSDKFQCINKLHRFDSFRSLVYELFLCEKFTYELFIEISEPLNQKQLPQGTLGPRLHLHGTIEFKTKSQLGNFLLKSVYKFLRVGNVYIHTMDDTNKWPEYYNKQKLFKRNRIASFPVKTVT